MNTPTNNPANNVRRIQTLEEHRDVLKHVFDTAKERVLIVSPFISSSAISADNIPALVSSAVRRNVQVAIYIDDQLNRDSSGNLKRSAEEGISSLVSAGAKVTVIKGIHNKTLARDTNLIAEGSFNWLSAVRTAGGTHQREERTIIIEGDVVASMIEKELLGLIGHGRLAQTAHQDEPKEWKAGIGQWIFAFMLLVAVFAILPIHPIASLLLIAVVFRYMYFLSEHSYPVKGPYSCPPIADGKKYNESISGFAHQELDDEDDESICDLTSSRFTPGYIGICDRRDKF